MPSELRAFVQVAYGPHGLNWVGIELPRTLRVPADEGPPAELDLPEHEPLFGVILGGKNDHYGGFLDADEPVREIPDGFKELDLYDPPHTRGGTWLTLHEILRHPWESILPHTTAPLFNEEDQGVTALVCCSQSLATLSRLIGFLNQAPSNIRLVFWLEGR